MDVSSLCTCYSLARLDFASKSKAGDGALTANHLQKLRVALKLTEPSGKAFVPQQVGSWRCLVQPPWF